MTFSSLPTRDHEILAFLNDETYTTEEKRNALFQRTILGVSALSWAVRRNMDLPIIEKMLEIGGKELVMKRNTNAETPLHYAAFCGSSHNVVKAIVEKGCEEVLLSQDIRGNTPMHYLCAWHPDPKIIKDIADIGQKGALMVTNKYEQVPTSRNQRIQMHLSNIGGKDYDQKVKDQKDINIPISHLLLLNRVPEVEYKLENKEARQELYWQDDTLPISAIMLATWLYDIVSQINKSPLASLVSKMIKVGGKKLVLQLNSTNSTVLHYACFNKAPLEIIALLVEAAGNDALEIQNNLGSTPLHDACFRQAPVEVIRYLVKQGGDQILLKENEVRMTPLEVLYNADIPSNEHILALQHAWPNPDQIIFSHIMKRKTELWIASQFNDPFDVIYGNGFLEALMNELFILPQYQILMFCDLYVQIVIILILTLIHSEGLPERLSMAMLILVVVYAILRDVVQMVASPIDKYFQRLDNIVDITQIGLLCRIITILRLSLNDSGIDDLGFQGTMVFAAGAAWVKLFIVSGQFYYKIAIFTSAFIKIIFELAPFGFTAVLITGAFAQVYFLAGSNTHCENINEWYCHIGSSFFQSASMFVSSNYEFIDWTENKLGRDQILLTGISFFFAIVVGILLLNILIAVVSNVFTVVTEEADEAFWRTRIAFMTEVNTILSFDFSQEKIVHQDVIPKRIEFSKYNNDLLSTHCKDTFFQW
eukprot:CAMPEP_0203681384 /NCGR_PEP_ID=MMETSP0090-20130426/42563_1 /ASSEMBLY_ACC=CAM_ASM_001088 /TAXON_ID=426623 /ORGANISM="Chaetoceros affinis, Strain CCMP159" /LENGTH=705 /DNA_ID=CAMNT_0050549847 /DNA_START=89 /DNA_END=2203 /DNA_ORIENTATION=+